jgi:hypothetical protein
MAFRTFRIASPLVLFVALHAKVHLDVIMYEPLVLRPMVAVTARAIHAEVPVPLVDHLFADRVGGMLLPVVAGAANVDRARIVQQEHVVGRMRPVALRAISLLDGRMFHEGFVLLLDGVLMA